jgi:hypothetical protein
MSIVPQRGAGRSRAVRVRAVAALTALLLGVGVLGLAPTPAGAAYPCGIGICPWSGWMTLSFTHNSRPLDIVAILPGGPGGRLQAIVVDNAATYSSSDVFFGISSQVDPNGTTWTEPTALGANPMLPNLFQGSGYSGYSAFRDGQGFVHVWARAMHCVHCGFYLTERTDQTASGWSGWVDDSYFLPEAGGLNADGRLEVFGNHDLLGGVAPYGLAHRWQATTGGWSDPALWPTPNNVAIAVGRNADGRLEVFAYGGSQQPLASAWQTTPNGSWTPLFTMPTGPAVVTSAVNDADGRLEIFGYQGGNPLNAWQWVPNQNISPLAPMPALPTPTTDPPILEAARGRDGRLEVFTINSGQVYDSWQSTPGGSFGPWSPLPGATLPTKVDVVTNADGHLVVYTGTEWNVQET